jgi:hypothetical protein
MNKELLSAVAEAFGTAPLSGKDIYAKVLVHPDDSIAVYFINAAVISEQLQQRGYAWQDHLHAWVKHVATIEQARQETDGYRVTAAAFGL